MNFGCCEAESGAAATMARPNESYVTAVQSDGWLHQATAKFKAAIMLQVPVGYQDAAGFHVVQPDGLTRTKTHKPF